MDKTPSSPARLGDFCAAPPYVENRYSAGSIHTDTGQEFGTSSDYRKIGNPPLWSRVFAQGEDWHEGWRRYWQNASDEIASGSEFSDDRIGIEIQAYFKKSQWSRGVAVPNDGINEQVARYINGQVLNACGADTPETRLVGVMAKSDEPLARPMLTLVTSGPGGGIESAQIIHRALNDILPLFAVAVRNIRDDQSGVVKIIFMPEIYSSFSCNAFGIDWKTWESSFHHNKELEWGTASLIWCDNLIDAVLKVRETASLMIDEIFFDFSIAVDLKKVFVSENNSNPSDQALLDGLSMSPIDQVA